MFSFERMLKIWEKYGHMYWNGLGYTLLFAFVSVLMGLVLGLVLASGRMASVQSRDNLAVKALKAVAKFFCTAYVEVFRATPMLVQVFIIYYGIFSTLFELPSIRLFGFIRFERFFPGVVALAMNSGAYLCEIIRSGIQSIDGGQTEAARSLGLSQGQNMRFIILPQAIKNILPAIGNEFVTMVKETAIIQYLGISDLMYNNGIVVTATYNPLPCYYISAIIYLALNIILGRGMNIFERRLKKSER